MEVKVQEWMHEDEMTEDDMYNALFPLSKVEIVRLFPKTIIIKDSKLDQVKVQIQEKIKIIKSYIEDMEEINFTHTIEIYEIKVKALEWVLKLLEGKNDCQTCNGHGVKCDVHSDIEVCEVPECDDGCKKWNECPDCKGTGKDQQTELLSPYWKCLCGRKHDLRRGIIQCPDCSNIYGEIL